MSINQINPFLMQKTSMAKPLEPMKAEGHKPIESPMVQPRFSQGVDPVFSQSVKGFGQKMNPFAAEKNSFAGFQGNMQNGLSPLRQGALGEEALYTENGRLGKNLNLFA